MPRVSVIIPTYNCERFLGRAIDSALQQNYKDYEIIVVDDGSTDHTRNLLSLYEKNVQWIQQKNSGVSAARNVAISRATGEFLAYLDADDMWYPNKLDSQIAFMDAHKKCGLVHSDVSVIDEDDRILYSRFNHETQRSVPQGECLEQVIRRCHIQTLTVVERRECFDRAGSFDDRLPIAQDYHHWMRAAVEGFAFGYISAPLGKYRWRRGSLMTDGTRFLEDVVLIYQSLLDKEVATGKIDKSMKEVVAEELHSKHRELAYLERKAGKFSGSRSRIKKLLKGRPWTFALYLDLLRLYSEEMFVQGQRLLAHGSTKYGKRS
ncbi:MAG: glycosyltransferase [Nitrospira sp.]|nr:MAG: glycosyltransferase [Nitrospira sp.]